MCLSYISDITDVTLTMYPCCDQTIHFLTTRTGDSTNIWLAVGMLKLSVTAVRLWSEFKSSAPWWLLSICQLRGVWEAEPEGEWGKERERETRPCFSVWHLVAHLRFLLRRQWGFWAHWQHRAHTKAQKNTAIHSNKFSARLYVWAHKCWDKAMQMQGEHRAQQKELSSRCNRYDVIQRLLYFCLEALRWAFWSLHSSHFETECDKLLL